MTQPGDSETWPLIPCSALLLSQAPKDIERGGASKLLASLGHIVRKIVLGRTENTLTLTIADELNKRSQNLILF